MRRINEIFYSLQGEGYYTGKAAIFIRFSGCNLKCNFCDTEHEEGTVMSDEEIIEAISVYPSNLVVLTGGEPALWINEEFIEKLHKAGKYVCIETNGTHKLPENIDWVTCSPKEGAPICIDRMDEVKVVYLRQDLSPYISLPAKHHYIQPCSCRNTAEIVEYILQHPEWQLSLQSHKLIDIP